MTVLLCALLAFFIIGNAWTEIARSRMTLPAQRLDALTNPISNYLHGPKSGPQVWGFGALALACVLYAWTYEGSWIARALMGACAIGLVFVVLTKRWTPIHVRLYHLIASGITFVSATVAELIVLHGTALIVIPLLGIASATLFARFAPDYGSIEEKVYVLLVVVGFFALVALLPL